jgi:competence protein ComEC
VRFLLPALAGAYVLGLVLADLEAAPAAVWIWLAVHASAAGLATPHARQRLAAALAVSLLAGATAGAREHERARRDALAGPREAVVEALVAERSGFGPGLEVVLAEARPVPAGAEPLPERILVRAEAAPSEGPAWRDGSWVRVALRLAPVRGRTNPGGRDPARALARRGIGGVAREADPLLRAEIAPPPRPGLEGLAAPRRRAAERLVAAGAGGALLAALGLGEAGALSAELRRDLARLGLSHLVAVSGLHLWLVAGPVYLAAAALLRRSAALSARGDTRRAALGIAALAGALYAVFTGLAAPVQRALVFLALLALAQLARRRLVTSVVLGAAALAVAVADPAAPFAPGVQLSFAATAALVFGVPAPLRERRGVLGATLGGLATALRVSASATAATAPLVALHFGTVSPLGWLANGIAVPLTAFALLPLALAAGGAALLLPEDASLATLAIQRAVAIAGASLGAVAWLAARTPAWAGVAPGALGLTAATLLALACLRARRTSLRLGLALLAATAPRLGPAPRLDPPAPRAVFLDVGQGDAVVVQGREASLLVDGGVAISGRFDAGERVVLPALGALGIDGLALVVASHADLDHAGGLGAVLGAVPVERLWLPPGGRSEPGFAALVAMARARGIALEERAAEDPPLVLGDLRIETLWPRRGAARRSRNDASLVLRVEVAGRVVLLPGDLEAAGERGLVAARGALRADVLKLGHHGSRTSTHAAWLRAVAPALAIVSAPRHGRFGMPHAEVVARLVEQELPWCWTGRDGAVLVELEGRLRARGFASGPRASVCGAR